MKSRILSPYGWVGHIPFAFFLIERFKPEITVELGTHTGNSFIAFCEGNKLYNGSGKVYAIDTWKGDDHSGLYPESVYFELNKYVQEFYLDIGFMIRKNFNDAVFEFKDNSIDCLHIDGLHTYDAVKNDFYSWLPKLKENSIVLVHDTRVKSEGFGVYKFWDEISEVYPNNFCFEHSNGLGVLSISKDLNSESNRLISDLKSDLFISNLLIWSGGNLEDKLEAIKQKEAVEINFEKLLMSKPILLRNHLKKILKFIGK